MKHIGLPALARNCHSVGELEQARDEWWERYEKLDKALKYSGSCISDQEYRSEALRHWQDCLDSLQFIKSSSRYRYTFKK